MEILSYLFEVDLTEKERAKALGNYGIEIGKAKGVDEASSYIIKELSKMYDDRAISRMLNLPLMDVQKYML